MYAEYGVIFIKNKYKTPCFPHAFTVTTSN